MHSRWYSIGTIGFDSYFSGLTEIVFPEAELFTGVTRIGSEATTTNSGWAAKRVKINLPSRLVTISHKAFYSSNFYAQDQLVIPASTNQIAGERAFSGISTLTDIIFLADTFTAFSGYNLINGTNANLVFPNATAVPPSGAGTSGFGGYVYVPDSLVDAWKSLWSSISSRILPLSEWTNQ